MRVFDDDDDDDDGILRLLLQQFLIVLRISLLYLFPQERPVKSRNGGQKVGQNKKYPRKFC